MELALKENRIDKAAFTGEGCAISLAAADLFAGMLEGRTREEAEALIRHFTAFLKKENTGLDDDELEDLTTLEGVSRFPARIKCALLPFIALKEAMHPHG
jgi:nitrogen fixation NifU-like protein